MQVLVRDEIRNELLERHDSTWQLKYLMLQFSRTTCETSRGATYVSLGAGRHRVEILTEYEVFSAAKSRWLHRRRPEVPKFGKKVPGFLFQTHLHANLGPENVFQANLSSDIPLMYVYQHKRLS